MQIISEIIGSNRASSGSSTHTHTHTCAQRGKRRKTLQQRRSTKRGEPNPGAIRNQKSHLWFHCRPLPQLVSSNTPVIPAERRYSGRNGHQPDSAHSHSGDTLCGARSTCAIKNRKEERGRHKQQQHPFQGGRENVLVYLFIFLW